MCTGLLQQGVDEHSLTLSVLCGDLNFQSSDGLARLITPSDRNSHPYHDCIAGFSSPAVESLESASIGITFPSKTHKPRRSDFVLYNGEGWTCREHKYFGNIPIVDSTGKKVACDTGRDGFLYPSDHLGVLIELTRAT